MCVNCESLNDNMSNKSCILPLHEFISIVRNKIIRTQSATVIAAQNDTTVNNESLQDTDDTD